MSHAGAGGDAADNAGGRRRRSDGFIRGAADPRWVAALLVTMFGGGGYLVQSEGRRADRAEQQEAISRAEVAALTEQRNRSEDLHESGRRERDESQERRLDGIERRLEYLEHRECKP